MCGCMRVMWHLSYGDEIIWFVCRLIYLIMSKLMKSNVFGRHKIIVRVSGVCFHFSSVYVGTFPWWSQLRCHVFVAIGLELELTPMGRRYCWHEYSVLIYGQFQTGQSNLSNCNLRSIGRYTFSMVLVQKQSDDHRHGRSTGSGWLRRTSVQQPQARVAKAAHVWDDWQAPEELRQWVSWMLLYMSSFDRSSSFSSYNVCPWMHSFFFCKHEKI